MHKLRAALILLLATTSAGSVAARPRHQHLLPDPYPEQYFPDYPAISEGLVFTVQQSQTAQSGEAEAPLSKLTEIAPRLGKCWNYAGNEGEITIRLSFSSSGAIIGKPRITFTKTAQGPDGQAALANSITAALKACTPLRFTPSLGSAIAGRIFAIRFIAVKKPQQSNT